MIAKGERGWGGVGKMGERNFFCLFLTLTLPPMWGLNHDPEIKSRILHQLSQPGAPQASSYGMNKRDKRYSIGNTADCIVIVYVDRRQPHLW